MMKTKFIFLTLSFFSQCLIAQEIQTFGKGNIKGVSVNASSNSSSSIKTLLSTGYLPNAKSSSRFLSQATLGPKITDIVAIQNQGIETWLDSQLNLPYTFNLRNYVQIMHQYAVDSSLAKNPGGGFTLANVFIDDWAFDVAWFQGTMVSADQLRWRTSLALSQIFVTSRISAFDENPYAIASYYDVLNRNAFSTYRALLDSITYHPTMAVYLTYINNKATNLTKNVFPDENYAREIMQLFSIGLYELNMDGSEKKDENNKSIPTYDNEDITNLAKVFTGLGWGDRRYLGEGVKDKWSYTKRLKFFPKDSTARPVVLDGHELGPKTFLGQTIPGKPFEEGQTDIRDALDILNNHPNVPPFISRRLIQHLVTSNPSRAFVQRIAEVFVNNGLGVRGDLKAVIRAILLDPEARDCCADKENTTYGHLREPFLRYMNIVKGLNLRNSNGVYRNVMNNIYDRLEQKPMISPSVFNFYSPNYVPDGPLAAERKVGPEFQMLNSLSVANYMNALHNWLINNDPVEFWNLFSGETYKPDQDPRFDLSLDYYLSPNNRLPEFLDKYNLILAQGKVSKPSMSIIENVLKSMPLTFNVAGIPDATLADRRLRMGIFLLMISPDYVINR